jgi:hypothetical protein
MHQVRMTRTGRATPTEMRREWTTRMGWATPTVMRRE